MGEQIKTIEHLEALYGPRPLWRQFVEQWQQDEARKIAREKRDAPSRPIKN